MAQQTNSVVYSTAIQSLFFKERQHTLELITDTISSKLLNYDIFNVLCGMNTNMWKVQSFNFSLWKKLQEKLSDDCVNAPDLFISLQRGTHSDIWCLIVH